MTSAFVLLKLLHLVAMSLYVGVSFVNGYTKVRADRSGDVDEIVAALTWINRYDRVFLIPASVALLLSGLGLGLVVGREPRGAFLLSALLLFGVLTLLLVVSLPMESRLHALARAARDAGTALPAAYWRLSRVWALTGTLATALILLTLMLMVAKRPLLVGGPLP